MKKDAYYFPHYSNAKTDVKILKLRRVLGIEGYGIYFMLLEELREQTNFTYPLKNIPELEFEFRISKEKIYSVINDFDLFLIEGDIFYSPKLILYLQPYLEKSQRARDAANKRWNKVKDECKSIANVDAKALQMEYESITFADASKVNESKIKESKVKDISLSDLQNILPTEKIELNKWSQNAIDLIIEKEGIRSDDLATKSKINNFFISQSNLDSNKKDKCENLARNINGYYQYKKETGEYRARIGVLIDLINSPFISGDNWQKKFKDLPKTKKVR